MRYCYFFPALSVCLAGSLALSQISGSDAVFSIAGGPYNASAGSVMASVPDADGDTLPDLLVGDPEIGAVYLVFDAESGSESRTLLDNSVEIALPTFGSPVFSSSGDLDNDGLSEIILGLPEMNGTGAVAIFYGRSSWPDFLFAGSADILLTGSEQGEEAGATIAIAQRPGYPGELELVVGAPGAGGGTGKVYRVPTSNIANIGKSSVDKMDWWSSESSESFDEASNDLVSPTPAPPLSLVSPTPSVSPTPTPSPTPDPSPTPSLSPTPWVSPTPENTSTPVSPTPYPTESPYPTYTPSPTPTATSGTATPGTATPGTATPGTATPGTATPGTATPSTETPYPTMTPADSPTPIVTPTPVEPTPLDRPETPVTTTLSSVADLVWVSKDSSPILLGSSVVNAGDLDFDGLDDFALAAPATSDGGEVFVILSAAATRDQEAVQNNPSLYGILDGGGDEIVMASPGDVDGDGVDDLLVSAIGASIQGRVYVVAGGLAYSGAEAISTYTLTTLSGANSSEMWGHALTGIPDLNGDGRDEILISAPRASNDTGSVHFFLGRESFEGIESSSQADYVFTGDEEGSLLGDALVGGTVSFLGAPGDPVSSPTGVVYGVDLSALAVDEDGDGYGLISGDCDDQDATVYPTAEELCDGQDNDCDGVTLETENDADSDGAFACVGPDNPVADCDDDNADINPSAEEVCDGVDNNCDGLTDEGFDLDADGFTTCMNDCDDSDSGINPDASEVCDGTDNNCDGSADEGFDQDADGFISCSDDCDDGNSSINPDAEEVCDSVDNNCDGQIDEGFDTDTDGYIACQGDCDDQNDAVYPEAEELCDGVDNDCDEQIDEGFDVDSDGYVSCTDDCDDTDDAIHPEAEEVCDGVDNNCDGQIDEGFDSDSDGFTTCGGDCDDTNAEINPDALELCDGFDNNCDEQIDGDFDTDGDGYSTCDGDCNDSDIAIYPGADELCDGVDNNCNMETDEGFDADSDGYASCGGDCDDANAEINPDASEVCDSIDNNCDSQVDEGFDLDSDGETSCGGDCDDSNAEINTSASEACDGVDNNCDGQTDEGFDLDEDGYLSCDGDCDDSSAITYPGAEEIDDGLDNDCDEEVDEDLLVCDEDGDGYENESCTSTDVDCDDEDASIHPGAAEGTASWPTQDLEGDGKDNDCDGDIDEGTDLYDDDGDGFSEEAGDCNDMSEAIYPGAIENLEDGVDNNCDGNTDEDDPLVDNDGDGYSNQDGDGNSLDCDDSDADIHPNAEEIPGNSVDEDCDGALDVDMDGDGSYSAKDCDDSDPSVAPGLPEIPGDGIDNNCDGQVDEGFEGVGLGCGALSEMDGVAFSCSIGARESGRMPLGAWFLSLALFSVYIRRRKGG